MALECYDEAPKGRILDLMFSGSTCSFQFATAELRLPKGKNTPCKAR